MSDHEAGRAAFRDGKTARALDLLLPLARAGDAEAQRLAGLAYLDSMTANPCRSVSEGLYWLRVAADQDDARAAYQLGSIYKHGDVGLRADRSMAPAMFRKALTLSEPAAEAGSAEHQFVLGCMYWRGDGVRKNARRGLRWLRLAAEQGDIEHQSVLGNALWWASESVGNMDEAVHWTAKVAEQGHTGAQYHLAANYAVGDEIAQDLGKARKWYRLAARLGHEEAAYNLGWMLILGEGGGSDVAAAMKQLAKAADGGSLDAMDLIAEIHARGLYGQPKDPERAAGRYITAIAAGNRRSARNLADSLSEGRIDHGALKTALLRWAADTD